MTNLFYSIIYEVIVNNEVFIRGRSYDGHFYLMPISDVRSPDMSWNLKGQLLVWEGATTACKKFKLREDPGCPTCGG